MTAVAARTLAFFVFWLVIAEARLTDMPVGVVAAGLATWTSLRLLPPGRSRLSPRALAMIAVRFPWQSAVAGIDVARRAFDPRLPLRPGLVTCELGLSPGPACNAYCTLMSLLPGTVPIDIDESGALIVHCLDVDQPVATALAAEARLFALAMGRGHDLA